MSFSFGTPASAPASGLTGGFNFGANKPTTTGFGTVPPTLLSASLFGTPTTSAPAFGSTANPAFGATPPSQPSASLFGAPTTSAPAFGGTSNPGFGAAATTPAFGASSNPAFGVSSAPAFGTSSTPAFGASTTPAFGGTQAPAFGGGGLNFGTGTATSSAGLSFGTPATTTSTGLGLGGFGFGTSQPSTTQTPGFGLLGGTSAATTTTSLFGTGLGTTNTMGALTTTTTPSFGLGGLAPAAGGIGITTTASSDAKEQQPKQTKLPNELMAPVESFKEFVKKQKSLSSDVMRVSIKPLHKVSREVEEMLRAVLSLNSEVGKSRAQSRRLRALAADALAAAEQAGRDIPGSELEGSAPPVYVKELISELEQQVIAFRRQMDVADKQMQAAPKLLSEQELTLGIRRMHESFVALAARLQAVHAQVEAQKEQYLNLRKYVLKDPTDVFDSNIATTSLDQILRDAEGNKKKTKLFSYSDVSHGSAVIADPRAALGSMQQLAGPTPFTYLGSTMSPYPNTETGSSWHQPQPPQPSFVTSLNTSGFTSLASTSTEPATSSFQLQKPPKRGKQ